MAGDRDDVKKLKCHCRDKLMSIISNIHNDRFSQDDIVEVVEVILMMHSEIEELAKKYNLRY